MELNVDKVIKTCDFIGRITTEIGGGRHGSTWLFNQCMRAFDNKRLPAQAVTYKVWLNAPVNAPAHVTIYRDGTHKMERL